MPRAKRLNICLIPDGHGPARNFKLRSSTLFFLIGLGAAFVLGLVAYSFYSYRFISGLKDRTEEVESLRAAKDALEARISDFTETVESLDDKLRGLAELEAARAVLTDEFRAQLGLPPETPVEEVLTGLASAVAWAERPADQLGGDAATLSGEVGFRDMVRNLNRDLDRLMLEADQTYAYLLPLNDGLAEVASILAATPAFLPLKGQISSKFGARQSPFGGRTADFHRGLDIPAPNGTSILTPADGLVLASGQSGGGYGLLLTIDHGYGLVTRYGHLESVLVEPGQSVVRGQAVAKSGNSGRSTGPHLHYEVILGGLPVDPLKLLAAVSPVQAREVKIMDEADGAAAGGRAVSP